MEVIKGKIKSRFEEPKVPPLDDKHPEITSIKKLSIASAVMHGYGYIYMDRSGNLQIDYGRILIDKMKEFLKNEDEED